MTISYSAKDLLAGPITADYMPEARISGYLSMRNRPHFSGLVVKEMLADPRIVFGLWLIKGPILANAKFSVDSDDETIRQFVIRQVNRFWRNSAVRALKSIEWGYSGGEVLYYLEDGLTHFDVVKDVDSLDVRVVTRFGELQGLTLRNVPAPNQGKRKIFLGGPKAFLHVTSRERNPWYGQSRLFGAHIPWWEQWSDGGYRDVRRLWFYKNAYEGGAIYHPPGITRTKEGVVISNKDLAREMIEKKRTGGTLTFPNITMGDQAGQRAWEYIPPQPNQIPAGLLEYGTSLRDEILEGMGIPPEVIESAGAEGFGSSSGRAIPQMAFYSTLQEIVQWLITDADNQIIRPLVQLNFGSARYEIVPFSLLDALEKDEAPPPEKPEMIPQAFPGEEAKEQALQLQ